MTDKPNIVLVHGAFADGSHWRPIIPGLFAAGHQVMAAHDQRRRRRLTPIRRYTKRVRPKKERPFAAEYTLLAELALRRS